MVEKDFNASSMRVRTQLHCVVQKLDITAGVIRTQIAALRDQNCKIDEDVALVLQYAVAEPLYEQTEQVRTLLAELSMPVPQRDASTHSVPA